MCGDQPPKQLLRDLHYLFFRGEPGNSILLPDVQASRLRHFSEGRVVPPNRLRVVAFSPHVALELRRLQHSAWQPIGRRQEVAAHLEVKVHPLLHDAVGSQKAFFDEQHLLKTTPQMLLTIEVDDESILPRPTEFDHTPHHAVLVDRRGCRWLTCLHGKGVESPDVLQGSQGIGRCLLGVASLPKTHHRCRREMGARPQAERRHPRLGRDQLPEICGVRKHRLDALSLASALRLEEHTAVDVTSKFLVPSILPLGRVQIPDGHKSLASQEGRDETCLSSNGSKVRSRGDEKRPHLSTQRRLHGWMGQKCVIHHAVDVLNTRRTTVTSPASGARSLRLLWNSPANEEGTQKRRTRRLSQVLHGKLRHSCRPPLSVHKDHAFGWQDDRPSALVLSNESLRIKIRLQHTINPSVRF
mmetsp:Transcript_66015/g.174969  ORF Transcript_66015/g.174969 Transcript_66015/m.174969 type:complete len:413 (+) Transcript_66015:368-1606(+)